MTQRLKLNKETLRLLAPREAQGAIGGMEPVDTEDLCLQKQVSTPKVSCNPCQIIIK